MRKIALTVIYNMFYLCFLIYSSQSVLDKYYYFLQIWEKKRLSITIFTLVSHLLKSHIANE